MSGRSHRPRPNNGSGDSPRPPFLTEFVNQIRESDLVHPIYRLIGGALFARVHPHVEWTLRLKTESPLGVAELQRAQPQVGQDAIARSGCQFRDFAEAALPQLDLRPVVFFRRQTLAGDCQRARILIEANQTTLSAEASCQCETVAARAHDRVDIVSAAPYG